jgi:DNA (cytosine-5)-methyltransferase 1
MNNTKCNKHLKFLKYIDKSLLKKKIFNNKKILKVGTDCSGIEAPIQALQLLNIPFKHVFSCDNDKYVIESIKGNYNPTYIYNDIFDRDYNNLPKIDMYIAGFPCQAFSLLGKREGFDDTLNRGIVFFACLKTIKKLKPDIFILENVKGLLNHDNGKTFKLIIELLKKLKIYDINYKVLNTKDYGIPQNRERVFIIGLKKNKYNNFEFPNPIKLPIKVDDIICKNVTDKKYGKLTPHKKKILSDLKKTKKIKTFANNWSINLNVSSHKRTSPMLDVSPCLLAGNGGDCIYYLSSIKRRYTPREYLNLQGFGTDFKQVVSDSKMYKQVGNSMSVNVLAFLYLSILKSLN